MYAQRPLTYYELTAVLSLSETGSAEQVTHPADKQYLLSSCANLLEFPDEGITVRMIHYSVHEYFTGLSNRRLSSKLLDYEKHSQQIHTLLSTTCISYLISSVTTLTPELLRTDLFRCLYRQACLWYAACQFDVHIEQSGNDSTLIDLAKVLLSQSPQALASILQVRAIRPKRYKTSEPNFRGVNFDAFEQEEDASMLIFNTKLYSLPQLDGYWRGKQLHPSLLRHACSTGTSEAVEFLLDSGVDVNTKGGDGISPLYAAIEREHIGLIRTLLAHGAEVNIAGGQYGCPLQIAAVIHDERITQLLLDAGADVNAQGGDYGNALQAACIFGTERLVQLLLDAGADVNAQGALQAAVEHKNERIVQLLLDAGADVNAGGDQGSALYWVAVTCYKRMLQKLLEALADVENGNALQAAACSGHETTARILLSAGADVNAHSVEYGSALQAAAVGPNEGLIELFLDNGADINAQGGFYGNALQAACCSDNSGTVVRRLLDAGANVDARGGEYGCALQAAIVHGKEVTMKILLDAGADVNVYGGKFASPLQGAAYFPSESLTQSLLDYGADIDGVTDTECGSAVFMAICERRRGTLKLLLESGADIHRKIHGKTALQYAREIVAEKVVFPETLEEEGGIIEILLAYGAHDGPSDGKKARDEKTRDEKTRDEKTRDEKTSDIESGT